MFFSLANIIIYDLLDGRKTGRIFDRCSRSFYFDQLASNSGALAMEAPIGHGMKCTVLSVAV